MKETMEGQRPGHQRKHTGNIIDNPCNSIIEQKQSGNEKQVTPIMFDENQKTKKQGQPVNILQREPGQRKIESIDVDPSG